MNKLAISIGGIALVGVASWAIWGRGDGGAAEIEYRYSKVEKGELVRSTSAVGQLVPLTKVDIRSKAGGKVVSLAVEEGDIVSLGDLVARIDPDDTQTVVDQARADLTSSEARAESARISASLEVVNRQNAVRDAEIALEIAQTRLSRITVTSQSQPELSKSELASSQAALRAQQEALKTMESVEIPRMRNDARVSLDRARVEMDTAQSEFERMQTLLAREFVSQSEVDRARSSYESARASHANAQERIRTIEAEIESMLRAQRARVDQASASLRSSTANQSRIQVSQKDLQEARQSVAAAKLDLQRAKNDLAQARIRDADRRTAEASIVRSQVSLRNAEKQLNETTVLAPRPGVVTRKYLEEGTIIPPGTSTFSQGTAIVELSDVSQMFVECAVDEADISAVKVGQPVRILVEAYPGQKLQGKVDRINPAAQTEQNITAIRVRVKITDANAKLALMPGMNATCEFLTLQKKDVVIVPSQAIQREDGKTYVRIKGADPKKPSRVEVTVGETGNDGIEVLKGLEPGAEVVVAEINLTEMRQIQQRMQEAQQGGGLAGGRPQGGSSRSSGSGSSRGGASGGGGGGGR